MYLEYLFRHKYDNSFEKKSKNEHGKTLNQGAAHIARRPELLLDTHIFIRTAEVI